MEELLEKYGSIDYKLVGHNSNAFSLMALFRRKANEEGWMKEDINLVIEECMSGDYNHLLRTLVFFQSN